MSSDSFFKNLARSTLTSFFKVVAVGFGFLAIMIAFSIILKSPPAPHSSTTATVVPNHEWKVGALSPSAPTIVKININGTIGTEHMTEKDIRNQLVDTIDGDIKISQVKGILLAINTPGGTADDSNMIYQLLLEYKKRFNVPVYAYVDGICASGGTMISCAADKVYSSESSVLGHVGVLLGPIFNFYDLMQHVGIESKTITAGKGKDNLNPFRQWKPGEEVEIQNITNDFYDQFISIVSKHRPKLTKEILQESGACIYAASEAEKLGYIDGRLPTLESALEQFATECGIVSNYQVVELSAKKWFDSLFEESALFAPRKVEHTVKFPGQIPAEFSGKVLYMYAPSAAE